MKKGKMYIIIIILIIIIAIFTINIKKRKNKENIIETTQDIARSNEINGMTNIIADEPKEYVKVLQDGTRENKSSKVVEEKTVGNLKINNISLTSDGKDTYLKADVKSTIQLNKETKLSISLIKEDGSRWITFNDIVLKTNDENIGKINLKISDADFTNAYDLKIDIK